MDELIRIEGVSKSFPGVKTLDRVSFTLRAGEVNALVGENGAGKSSLMKIITGVYQPDEGEIYLFGEKRRHLTPRLTRDLGISMIHQELSLVPQMNAVQNLLLGREIVGMRPFLDLKKSRKEAQAIFERLELDVDLNVPVSQLPIAQQQMIEIGRCLYAKSKVIIMDEPTSSLTEKEVRKLLQLVKTLKEEKIGIIYISHFLKEIFQVSDRCTVLRDGKLIDVVQTAETNEDNLVRMMVGRELSELRVRSDRPKGREVLRLDQVSNGRDVKDVSLTINEGEIVGLAGIIGAGRTSLARMIIGDMPVVRGQMLIRGKPVNFSRPRDAIKAGIAYIPEDRKGKGLVLGMSVASNISLPVLNRMTRQGLIRHSLIYREADRHVHNLNIKPANYQNIVRNLSGGNQQKVVLGKWLAANANIFIFNEPTRGIDIGAKREIYKLMDELAQKGAAILLISSELPELLGVSDRIAVMNQGYLVKEWPVEEASEELIVKYALDQGGENA
jgi:ribose transport system ATP-binding protein